MVTNANAYFLIIDRRYWHWHLRSPYQKHGSHKQKFRISETKTERLVEIKSLDNIMLLSGAGGASVLGVFILAPNWHNS